MSRALLSFNQNIESIKVLDNLHKYFESLLTALDLSEILRAEIVLIVSAFDCYIHDIVKYGMMDIFNEKRDTNKKFEDFSIPFSLVKQVLLAETETERNNIIELAIKKVNSKDSFQSPINVANALQLISVKKIWNLVKEDMELSPIDIEKKLGLIIHIRNNIVHEAGINRLTGEKNEILREDLEHIFGFIKKLVNSIDNQIN